MPTYTAIFVPSTTTVSLPVNNSQVSVSSGSLPFEQFTNSQLSENPIISEIMIISNDIQQLTSPISFIQIDPNGERSGIVKVPAIDNYQYRSQVKVEGEDLFVFNGLNSLQYEVKANTTVTLIAEFTNELSLTNQLTDNLSTKMYELSLLLTKHKEFREAQELLTYADDSSEL